MVVALLHLVVISVVVINNAAVVLAADSVECAVICIKTHVADAEIFVAEQEAVLDLNYWGPSLVVSVIFSVHSVVVVASAVDAVIFVNYHCTIINHKKTLCIYI